MNRQITVDIFRALAVLLVTSFHVWRVVGKPEASLGLGFDLLAPIANGWVGVGMFFVISGYCMGASAEKLFQRGWTAARYGDYLISRFLRIAPSYYVAIGVWYVLINVYQVAVKPTGAFDVLTHLFFVHNLFDETFFTTSGVFWSVAVEIQLYLFLPFLIAFAPTTKSRVWVLLATAVLSFWVSALPDQYRVIRWGVPNYLFLFVVGWLLYCYKERVVRFFDTVLLRIALGSALIAVLLFNGGIAAGEAKFYEAIVSVLGGLCMVVLARSETRFENYDSCRVLSFIGKCSFSIYLYNYIFAALLPVKPTFLSFVMLVLCVIGFGIMMYYLVEVQAERLRKSTMARRRSTALA